MPSRMNSHMPEPYNSSMYIDDIPMASRRRFTAASEHIPIKSGISSQNNSPRNMFRDRSGDLKAMFFGQNQGITESLILETNSKDEASSFHQRTRDNSSEPRGIFTRANSRDQPKRYNNMTETQQKVKEKPPSGSNIINNSIMQRNSNLGVSSTTVVEVNRDKLEVDDSHIFQKTNEFLKTRRSSLGSFSLVDN